MGITSCGSSNKMIIGAGPGESPPRNPEELAGGINSILADSAFLNANWAVLVVDLDSGEKLYDRNAEKSFIPASNGKIYTTAAALDQLGVDYTFTTPLFIRGDVVDNTLEGDVIVRGSGDPVIGGRFTDGDITSVFRSWADSLKAAGITRIRGNIIGDDNEFDDMPLGIAWSWDDEPYWYSAEISALSLNDNNVDFSFNAPDDGSKPSITWEPHDTRYVSVTNDLVSVPSDSARATSYSKRRGSNQFTISGDLPAGSSGSTSLSVFNPTLFFAHVLRETFVKAGIAVEGIPMDADVLPDSLDYGSPELRQIASHTSAPLSDIVYELNKISHNLYAEMLLKKLGTLNPVDDPDLTPGSAAMGIARAMDTFAAAGADTSRLHLKGGSGLSRMTYVTAEMTSSVLSYMWDHPDEAVRDAFLESLPIGGFDGTIESRFKDGRTYGKVRAKTGTLTGVSALSGFVPSEAGSNLMFVLMANQYTVPTSTVRRAQDDIVELLAAYQR
jgi:D-alanyl-D-alanine carboxypeptidase/D-alanyl-D-alanine-endopeptidase (penicillin-binding protein 4)